MAGEEDRDALAAEYVLGVLPAAERDAATRLARTDPAFAMLVADWQRRLDPLGSAYGETAPPAHLRKAVEARLFGAAESRGGIWNLIGFWRGAALAACVLLAIAVGVIVNDHFRPEPRLVASLSAEGSPVRYVALVDAGDTVRLSHVSGDRSPSRDFELWVIGPGAGPVSLGVVPVGAAVAVDIDAALAPRLAAGATLAISDEPAGGSPTGQPTGAVVAAGPLLGIRE